MYNFWACCGETVPLINKIQKYKIKQHQSGCYFGNEGFCEISLLHCQTVFPKSLQKQSGIWEIWLLWLIFKTLLLSDQLS